jgi:hypothetical protein
MKHPGLLIAPFTSTFAQSTWTTSDDFIGVTNPSAEVRKLAAP